MFIEHIRVKKLLDKKSRYLLGCSGGLDSVALGYLLKQSGYSFEIAHVNFGLRDEESNDDETFVRDLSKAWEVPIHVNTVNPSRYEVSGMSTQMMAREIRYNWFQDLIDERGLQGILVAHHFEDQVETILLNMLRGTGIEGIYGMSEIKGNVIRPLLPFKKGDLRLFMEENKLNWREDSSNQKSDYKRNFLRNQLFPLMEQKFPDALDTMDKSFSQIKDTGKAFFYFFQEWKRECIQSINGHELLELRDIIKIPGKYSLLFYWLRDYGFNYSDIEDIFFSVDQGGVGKLFFARDYMVNVDREHLILGKKQSELSAFSISKDDIRVEINGHRYDILRVEKGFPIDKNPQNAMLDEAKLSFPLIVRKWQLGDRIVPLGMKNEKKLSDLMVDMKIPVIEKQRVAVILSGEEIIWMVGHRISDRFKCDAFTEKILYLKKI